MTTEGPPTCARCRCGIGALRLAAFPDTVVCDDCTREARCDLCRGLIAEPRLEAIPDTRVCAACSRSIGGEFEYRFVEENMAKEGSLKKNYGGFRIEMRRKELD